MQTHTDAHTDTVTANEKQFAIALNASSKIFNTAHGTPTHTNKHTQRRKGYEDIAQRTRAHTHTHTDSQTHRHTDNFISSAAKRAFLVADKCPCGYSGPS